MRYKMGDLVELVTETNSDLKYGLDDIVGVTLEKQMIPTIANLSQTNLNDFIIVHPKDFVYNPRTHGKKIGLGFNTTDRCFISTWNNNTFRVKPNMLDTIIPEYLYMHFLRERWDREACFNAWGSSTVVLLWSSFCDMKINVPPISEQRKIVHDYQVITDRIELLRKMNAKLENMMETIFTSYVTEKSQGNKETIYRVMKVINGAAFSSDCFNTNMNGYPLVRIRDLKTCSPDVFTSEILPGTEFVNAGDILVGMDGEFIPHVWYGNTGVLNQRVCKIVPTRKDVHPMFLFWTLKPILAEIQRTQGGTTVIHIGKKDFDKMMCAHMTEDEHKDFYEKVDPMFKLLVLNYKEILKLSSMAMMIQSLMSNIS